VFASRGRSPWAERVSENTLNEVFAVGVNYFLEGFEWGREGGRRRGRG